MTKVTSIPYSVSGQLTQKQRDELHKISTIMVDDFTEMFIIKVDSATLPPGTKVPV